MVDAPVSRLLSKASEREQVNPGDGRSGSTFERVQIDGERYFLKSLSPQSDWIMRVTGDHVHRTYLVWRAGIMDQAPDSIDHTVVAMEVEGTGDSAVLSMLMRDVGPHLIPEGDTVVTAAQHRGFIEAQTDLAASFWQWTDTVGGLTTMAQRLRFFAPDNIAAELRVDQVPGPVSAADVGWRALPELSPLLARVASAIHQRPWLLTEPLSATPVSFLQGDWKMGNLGTHPDGRTIVLDWAYPGAGPPCWDLCWYMALNRARLPESKEECVSRFRAALEDRDVPTEAWWDRQIDLCIIGIMATFGWEKAMGDAEELYWWESRVADALERQALPLG